MTPRGRRAVVTGDLGGTNAVFGWLAFAAFVFAINFAWEMGQGALFVGMRELPIGAGIERCLRAAAGDVLISALSFAVATARDRSFQWPTNQRAASSILIFISVGLATTVVVEKWALASGRWKYEPQMPLIFGIGLAPVLQWVVLPAIEIALLRRLSGRPAGS